MMQMPLFQLWCYYDTTACWQMEGLFRGRQLAENYCRELRGNGPGMSDTPCMSDWAIIEVKGWW
jgi:hypothetical protein